MILGFFHEVDSDRGIDRSMDDRPDWRSATVEGNARRERKISCRSGSSSNSQVIDLWGKSPVFVK